MDRSRLTLRIIGPFFMVLGIVVGFFLHASYVERQLLEREGATVAGQITDLKYTKTRRSTRQLFTVAYVPQGQPEISRTFSVSTAYWNAHAANMKIVHREAEVRYLPADPKRAYLIGAPPIGPEGQYIGYGFAALGVILVYFGFRRPAPRR